MQPIRGLLRGSLIPTRSLSGACVKRASARQPIYGLWPRVGAPGRDKDLSPCGAYPADRMIDGSKQGGQAMQVTSTAFREGETIPKQYTADGKNVSPPLQWSGVPDGTVSLALICDDPDAPRGTWVHWVLFNLPPH